MHFNILSLKNKVDRLEVFLEQEKPDVVRLTEHHLKNQERTAINFENYYEGSIYCREQKSKRGGGQLFI